MLQPARTTAAVQQYGVLINEHFFNSSLVVVISDYDSLSTGSRLTNRLQLSVSTYDIYVRGMYSHDTAAVVYTFVQQDVRYICARAHKTQQPGR